MKMYKQRYEHQLEDKKTMSKMLYELMMYKYSNLTYEQRVEDFKRDTCRCCSYEDYCELVIPEDILKPIESEIGWIPPVKGCKEFEWR